MIYPDDDDGYALRRLESHGDDLSRRAISTSLSVLPTRAPLSSLRTLSCVGHEVSVERSEIHPDFPWDVVVVQHMAPFYEGITSFEDLLQSAAERWGGHNDGWGCFSQPRKQ